MDRRAKRLAAEGAKVAIGDLNLEAAQKTAKDIGADAFFVDVSDYASCEVFMRNVAERLGGIDIVVCNAAILISDDITEFDPNKWKKVSIDVNLCGFFNTVKAFYPFAVFILVEGVMDSFGLWRINDLYIWTVLVIAVMLFRKIESTVLWALISGIIGLIYGALCAIPYLFIGGLSSAASYWICGISFDLAHCVGNFIAALLLSHTYNILRWSLKECTHIETI